MTAQSLVVMHAQTLRFEIQKLKSLPPLPQNRQRILAAVNDPDIDIELLGELLAECPAITARLVGLANSAYFGRAGKIHTLKEAIVHLGLNMVKSLSLAIMLAENLKPTQCPGFHSERFWLNTLLNAQFAQQLTFALTDPEKPEPALAYTAGLLMQLGILALVCGQPELMQQIFKEARQDSVCIHQLLQEKFETDQYQIGKWIILRWQLPEIYAHAIGDQSQGLEQLHQAPRLSQLLAGARQLSSMILDSEDIEPGVGELSRLLNIPSEAIEKIMARVGMKKQELQTLARQFH